MNIGIDCRVLSWEPCGLRRHAFNLIRALGKLDTPHRFYLFSAQDFHSPVEETGAFRKVILASRNRLYWEQCRLPIALKKYRIGLFHNLQNYGIPRWGGAKVILTVHDLIPLLFPGFWESRGKCKRLIYKHNLSYAIRRASQIIVDSRNTRADIQRMFKTGAKPVTVASCGVDQAFFVEDNASEFVKEQFGISTPYLFHLSGVGLNKNTPCVIEAFQKARANGFSSLQLIIAGPSKPIAADRDGVRWVGEVSDRQLRVLYGGAAIFLYPSIYEGFGLPVLEAMACGTAVIVSRSSSLSEVAAEAAVYCDPNDCGDLAAAVEKILRFGQLRAALVKKGFEQAKRFSWSAVAEKVLEVYDREAEECAS